MKIPMIAEQFDDQLMYYKAQQRQCAFTLRKTKNPQKVTKGDYISHIQKLCLGTDTKLVRYCFESTAGLHMHGVLEIPNTIEDKRFRVRGWSMVIEEIYDYPGWLFYMMKEQRCNEDPESEIEDVHPVYQIKRSLFSKKYDWGEEID